VDPDLIPKLFHVLKKAKYLETVVYNDGLEVIPNDLRMLKELFPKLKIISLQDVKKLGEHNPVKPVPPHPDDLCCLMYTSGTTGAPKGVPLKHRNVVAASKSLPRIGSHPTDTSSVAGLETVFKKFVSSDDSVLCYLPLAHSFEFAFENCCFYWGVKMGYGSPRTLSDISMRNCKGDIKEFKPTILVGVPAVWETIRKGIEQKVAESGYLASHVFWCAMTLKAFLCAWKLPGPGLLDTLVFDKVKLETGGRLRACFNGAGPIGKETRRFISFAVVPMLMGYGLTETIA